MKTLLLTSSGKTVSKFLPEIIGKQGSDLKVAWITTAAKVIDDLSYLEIRRDSMIEMGWDFEEIDIEGQNQDELLAKLKDKDAIYIEGGNTFYLLKVIKESGFDKTLRKLIEEGIVYVGSSAGSYIMCPTIEMATWKTDSKPRYSLKDLTGLNYVPFLMSVHYDPKNKKILIDAIKNTKYQVKILNDN